MHIYQGFDYAFEVPDVESRFLYSSISTLMMISGTGLALGQCQSGTWKTGQVHNGSFSKTLTYGSYTTGRFILRA